MFATAVDVADDRTWPSQSQFREVVSPGGWSVRACRMQAPFILRDGKKTTVVHDGVLVLTKLNLIAVPIDTFTASYSLIPEEWK